MLDEWWWWSWIVCELCAVVSTGRSGLLCSLRAHWCGTDLGCAAGSLSCLRWHAAIIDSCPVPCGMWVCVCLVGVAGGSDVSSAGRGGCAGSSSRGGDGGRERAGVPFSPVDRAREQGTLGGPEGVAGPGYSVHRAAVGVSAMCALAHQRGVWWDGGLGWAEANVDAHVGWRG